MDLNRLMLAEQVKVNLGPWPRVAFIHGLWHPLNLGVDGFKSPNDLGNSEFSGLGGGKPFGDVLASFSEVREILVALNFHGVNVGRQVIDAVIVLDQAFIGSANENCMFPLHPLQGLEARGERAERVEPILTSSWSWRISTDVRGVVGLGSAACSIAFPGMQPSSATIADRTGCRYVWVGGSTNSAK